MKQRRTVHPLSERHASCKMTRSAWPALIEAQLRGAVPCGAARTAWEHQAGCPACAAAYAEVLALIRWREAEVPFNANALPLAARRLPDLASEGAPRDPVSP